jgi:6-phosphogluconolactonase (cycloisomerase 2 family)
MEILRRMSTRLTVLLGLVVLVSIGLLVACGSHYSASSDGLVIVPSRGSAVVQSFSLNLSNGTLAQISSAPMVTGKPTAVILDPAGAFAYVAVVPDSTVTNSVTIGSIAAYSINSDGTLTAGTTVSMNTLEGSDAVNPSALAIDSTGKFLFVADQTTTDSLGAPVAGSISVFAVSGGTVSEAPGSPFTIPQAFGGTDPSAIALAVTPTIFPASTATTAAACALQTPPVNEFLYVADAANDEVWEFAVDGGTGALSPPGVQGSAPGFPTGRIPSGLAIDPCNRFVYVANQNSNTVSGYTICNNQSPTCPDADGSLVSTGNATPAGNGPTAIAVDPFGNFVYVVNTQANSLSGFKITQVGGGLSPLSTPVVATGSSPVSIAIRGDGSWIFVTDNNSSNISQYAITPASGALAALPGITTDNFPYGVAVK